jgi:hypothetical protein
MCGYLPARPTECCSHFSLSPAGRHSETNSHLKTNLGRTTIMDAPFIYGRIRGSFKRERNTHYGLRPILSLSRVQWKEFTIEDT